MPLPAPDPRPSRPGPDEPTPAGDGTGPHQPTVSLPPATRDGSPPPDAAPEAGRFRAVRLHARGGLGEVHLAEDLDLGREVALKRIRAEYAGDAFYRERFLREAEITALLEHPGVVPVHALVRDPGGQPHYVMRFVSGESLQHAVARFYAAGPVGRDPDRRLAFRKLLGHFQAVCNTVGYAHSRGVIHRDIKPANVMLGRFGETLVIDWGLAKVVGRTQATFTDAEETLQHPSRAGGGDTTQMGHAVGTPAYMSPEQAGGRWDLVGPASDIYSLGATLACLLTGKAPVQGSNAQEVLTKVQRGDWVRPRRLNPGAPAALEAVCAKAMALDPARRYATAAELARDVEHWLADEPVGAHREALPARLARWARRRRTLVMTLAAAVLVGLAGLAGATALLSAANGRERALRQEAEGQRDEARRERERADANLAKARQAVEMFLTKVAQDRRLAQADLHDLRKTLLESAVPYYEDFARQQQSDPDREAERGRAYGQLGQVRIYLGENEAALADYDRMRDVFAALADAHPGAGPYRLELATSHVQRGVVLRRLGRREEAERAYRDALPLLQGLAEEFPDVAKYRGELGRSLLALGNVLRDLGRRDEAGEYLRRALAVRRELTESYPNRDSYRLDVANSLANLARLSQSRGQREEAASFFAEALATLRDLVARHPRDPEYHKDYARAQASYSSLLLLEEKYEEAARNYRELIQDQEKLAAAFAGVPDYRFDLSESQHNLGIILRKSGKRGEAEAAYREAIRLKRRLAEEFPGVPTYRFELGMSLASLGNVLRDQGRWPEAEAASLEALRLAEELTQAHPGVPSYREDLGRAYANLGHLCTRRGQPQEALEWFAKAISTLDGVLSPDPRQTSARSALADACVGRARALTRLGRYAEALPDWDRAVELSRGRDKRDRQLLRAVTLARTGESGLAKAEGDLLKALAEADAAAKPPNATGEAVYDAACYYALASGAVREIAPRRDEYAARAFALLRRAKELGYFRGAGRVAHMKADPDLDGIRDHEGYRGLVAELEAPAK